MTHPFDPASYLEDSLLRRWQEHGFPESVGERLLYAYRDRDRHYHGLGHLAALFGILDSDADARAAFQSLSESEQLVLRLALWYHDRNYDTSRGHNELRSCLQFLGDATELACSRNQRRRVISLILMSRRHRPPASDRTAQLFCDLDLSVLGASPTDYTQYARNIRKEYPDFSDWIFGWFRRRFLIASKKRRPLFHILKSREPQARSNINGELSGAASLTTIRQLLLSWVGQNKLKHITTVLVWASLPLVFLLLGFLFYPYSILVPALWLVNRLRWRYAESKVRSGNLLFLDEPQRRGLWQALSELYLDQNVQIPELASLLHASGYSAEEIRASLRDEVGPALARNLGLGLYPVSGPWAAYDPDRLRTDILVHTARGALAPTRWLRGFFSTWQVRRNLERALAYS